MVKGILNHSKIKFFSRFTQLDDRLWQDFLILTAFTVGGGLAAYWGQTLIDPALLTLEGGGAWFDGDVAQIFERMINPLTDQRRTSVHPLFPLFGNLPVALLRQMLRLSALDAVRTVMAIVAALWLASFFVFLRLIGCRRLDSAVFTGILATSSTAIFWFVVPETHSFSSLSLVLALCLFAFSQHYRLSAIWYIVISTLTLSLTVTDWWTGLILAKADHPWVKARRITLNALLGVTLLWGIQRTIFPFTEYFLSISNEIERVGSPLSIGPKAAFRSFLTHAIVMPKFQSIEGHPDKAWHWMMTQPSQPGSASLWGMVAVGLWLALLGLAIWSLFTLKRQRKIQLVLGLSIAGQLFLYLLYGWETFLYAPHFAPLLIAFAALSTLTQQRVLALLLAVLLISTAGINNILVFQQTRDFYAVQGTQRHLVQAQMLRRPADPWARGVGHVVLAEPGSQASDKAYHEPGGSFSPAVGSFGVSLWVVDSQGGLKTTSDAIPLDQIDQQWVYGAAPSLIAAPTVTQTASTQTVPHLQTHTPYYQATWAKESISRQNTWKLSVTPTLNGSRVIPVIRSVGAAGAPITSLQWQDQTLRINDRWTATLSPAPTKVYLGSELSPSWKTEQASLTQWQGKDGWGYARFEPAADRPWTLTIHAAVPPDLASTPDSSDPRLTIKAAAALAGLKVELPDRFFVDSLNAQVSQLMMGLVGSQMHPSEPTNSPVPWQQTGAYQLVGLVRAGKLDLARQLSQDLAEQDFSGGMGPEADAPGLSIWALAEVANALHDRQYDQWLWVHMKRKVALILEMLSATEEIHQPVTAPIVPALLIPYDAGIELPYRQISTLAKPSIAGLAVGRVGKEFPVLWVNAVSYRGLIDAANLADRIGQIQAAQQWRDRAEQLQQAWVKAFQSDKLIASEQNSIISLWQTWIADDVTDRLTAALSDRWQQARDNQGGFKQSPTQPALSLAEAHQWLYFKQSQRVWQTLQWFWQHQASPGLYTWWEGEGEVNTYNQWQKVRGWVKPPHVTPDYGSAAEMLLLQLDMLAYTDRAVKQPTIVIGEGVPAEWLKQPMQVSGIWTAGNRVNWQWNGKMLQVQIDQGQSSASQKSKPVIKLGSAFAPNTLLKVDYL